MAQVPIDYDRRAKLMREKSAAGMFDQTGGMGGGMGMGNPIDRFIPQVNSLSSSYGSSDLFNRVNDATQRQADPTSQSVMGSPMEMQAKARKEALEQMLTGGAGVPRSGAAPGPYGGSVGGWGVGQSGMPRRF